MKKPQTVIEAEAVASAKKATFDAAKEAMSRLENEWRAALAAVRDAQKAVDATLPQCRRVRVRWRSGNVEDVGNVVIVRRTPGGRLVVRNIGDYSGAESQFKWAERDGVFRQVEKGTLVSDNRELRDVPAEYLPSAQVA